MVEEFDKHDQERFPRPYNNGAMQDSSGVWIQWSAPDPGFKPRMPGEPRPSVPEERMRDSWLDLVDPVTGRTLARYREDGVLDGFVGGGSRYLVLYHESEAGVPYISLLDPQLSRGGAPIRR